VNEAAKKFLIPIYRGEGELDNEDILEGKIVFLVVGA